MAIMKKAIWAVTSAVVTVSTALFLAEGIDNSAMKEEGKKISFAQHVEENPKYYTTINLMHPDFADIFQEPYTLSSSIEGIAAWINDRVFSSEDKHKALTYRSIKSKIKTFKLVPEKNDRPALRAYENLLDIIYAYYKKYRNPESSKDLIFDMVNAVTYEDRKYDFFSGHFLQFMRNAENLVNLTAEEMDEIVPHMLVGNGVRDANTLKMLGYNPRRLKTWPFIKTTESKITRKKNLKLSRVLYAAAVTMGQKKYAYRSIKNAMTQWKGDCTEMVIASDCINDLRKELGVPDNDLYWLAVLDCENHDRSCYKKAVPAPS